LRSSFPGPPAPGPRISAHISRSCFPAPASWLPVLSSRFRVPAFCSPASGSRFLVVGFCLRLLVLAYWPPPAPGLRLPLPHLASPRPSLLPPALGSRSCLPALALGSRLSIPAFCRLPFAVGSSASQLSCWSPLLAPRLVALLVLALLWGCLVCLVLGWFPWGLWGWGGVSSLGWGVVADLWGPGRGDRRGRGWA